MTLKFFKCSQCGSVAVKVYDAETPESPCAETQAELVPNTVDAAVEKHVPQVAVDGSKVEAVVGSVEHPMADDHFITMIVLETKKGYQVASLNPGDAPRAVFAVAEGDEPVAVYEYCNLHGLWKAEI